MRFLSAEDWEAFRDEHNIPADAYELVEYPDPLGFDGGLGYVFPDSSKNPANYLRRNQLPPMKIEMTSIYNPHVQGTVIGGESSAFVPYLATKASFEYPEVKNETYNCLVSRTAPVTSSLTPIVYTSEEAFQEALKAVEQGMYASFVVHARSQSLQGNVNSYIITNDKVNEKVPQTTDCSNPTVGCFWFNDGDQIELPKDPLCRKGVVVRFKKYVLL